MLAGKVGNVRTYRATDGGEYMPEIAARVGLKLVPGAWIYSANEAKLQFGREASEVNAEETRALIRMANQNPNIERVLVGNENILRWDGQKDLRDPNATSPAQLIREIRNVKRNVKVPVSTAEPWHVWLNYPELAKEVDYLAVHILPYWDEQSSETPLEYLKDKIGQLAQGLPEQEHRRHRGRLAVERRGAAQPGDRAHQARDAGRAGQERPRHGGVAEGAEHPVLRGRGDRPAVEVLRPRRQGGRLLGPVECRPPAEVRLDRPDRDLPAMVGLRRLVAGGGAAADGGLPLVLAGPADRRASSPSAAWSALSTSAVAYGASVAAGTYMVTGEMIGWAVLAFFLVLSLAMALVQALELVETIWRRRWPREALPAAEMIARQPADRHWPKVSLHLAICNEPPAMVIQTIEFARRARLSRTSKSSSSTTTPRTPRCGGRCRITAPSSASASSSSTSTS